MESELWDAKRISEEYWGKEIYTKSALEIKSLKEFLDSAVKELEKNVRDWEKSEYSGTRFDAEIKSHELQSLKCKHRILRQLIKRFEKEQDRIKRIPAEAWRLNEQSMQLFREVDKFIAEILSRTRVLIDHHNSLRAEFEKLRSEWYFNNLGTDSHPPEAGHLETNRVKEYIFSKLKESL